MQNFLRFLSKFGSFLLFALLQGIALYFLFTANDFQQSVVFSSANNISGKLYKFQESLSGYFSLRENNESLLRENGELQKQISILKSELSQLTDTSDIALLRMKEAEEYRLIPARVLHNSVSHTRNYITLNVGSSDGISPEMGVANAEGIIGIVSEVSEHYSVVIPVLNPLIRFSCKLKKSNTSGSLEWDGNDRRFSTLEEIPPYVSVSKGDTVITSGYSAIFPEGIMVGTVEDYKVGDDANYLSLKIRLSVHFDAVSNVRVIDYTHREEMKKLKEEAMK
jgi:rod shape-determining protein MreC